MLSLCLAHAVEAPSSPVVTSRAGRPVKKSVVSAESDAAENDEGFPPTVGAKKPRTAVAQTKTSAAGKAVLETPDADVVVAPISKPLKKARAPPKKKTAVPSSLIEPQPAEEAVAAEPAKKGRASKKKAAPTIDQTDAISDLVIPAKKAKRAPKTNAAETNRNDDDATLAKVVPAKGAKRAPKPKPTETDVVSDIIIDEPATVAPAKKPRRVQKKAVTTADDDEEDEAPEVITSGGTKSRSKKTIAAAVTEETVPSSASPRAIKRCKTVVKKTAAKIANGLSAKTEPTTIANGEPALSDISSPPAKGKRPTVAARAKKPAKTETTNGAISATPDGPLGHMVVVLKRSEDRTIDNSAAPAAPVRSASPVASFAPANDAPHTLKIASWNVAGLRAMCKKNGMSFVQQQAPDIFCMQEIKCLPDQVPDEANVKGYHHYWNAQPGGHAGVALLTRSMPYHVHYGFDEALGQTQPDGRLITAEFNKFFVVCVYVPNSGRKLVRLDERLAWNVLFRDHLVRLNGRKPVIVCGDLNVSHTAIGRYLGFGQLPVTFVFNGVCSYCHPDLANPKTNTMTAGFTEQERAGMDELLAAGFVDTFRRLYPNRTAAYTYWTYMSQARTRNVGW